MEPINPEGQAHVPSPAPSSAATSLSIYGFAEGAFINVDNPDETFTMTCGCHYNAGMGGRSPLHPHVPYGHWHWCHGTVVDTPGCVEHHR